MLARIARVATVLAALSVVFGAGNSASAQSDIEAKVKASIPAAEAMYESLHRQPEVGKQETETARRVRSRLNELGYTRFETVPSLPTAVIAVLQGGKPGPVTCLRAEMDALRLEEKTGQSFASEKVGFMHACGHDAHMAILLGAADVLMRRRESLRGTVVLLFQPAEEVSGGADDIVADGVLTRLGVQRVFALHASPGIPVGSVAMSAGPVLAGSNYFTVTLTGRGSHAAFPHEGDDVLLAGAEMAVGLARLPARKLDVVNRPCVISVASFLAGDENTSNRLGPTAVFRGTVRTYEDIDVAPEGADISVRKLIESYVAGMAGTLGVVTKLELRKGSPPLRNDVSLTNATRTELASRWPDLKIVPASRAMTAEDFSYYTTRFPCVQFGLGIAKDKLGQAGLHTDTFTIHPGALEVGIRLMASLVELPLVPTK